MIMPPLFGRHHDGWMKRYLDTGEGHVVDTTRVVLGLNRSGAIVPVLMSLRESSSTEGAAGSFIGVMRPLQLATE